MLPELLTSCVLLIPPVHNLEKRILPSDLSIVYSVANEYKLDYKQRLLLLSIRVVENGGSGIEFGVLTPSARRYAGNHSCSFKLQAQYAAGTISKHYIYPSYNLKAFADRWAPLNVANDQHQLNKNWYSNVSKLTGLK